MSRFRFWIPSNGSPLSDSSRPSLPLARLLSQTSKLLNSPRPSNSERDRRFREGKNESHQLLRGELIYQNGDLISV